jgi:hypothetical protein
MSQYHLYTLNKRGRLFGPAQVIEAANDDEAAAQAKRFQNGLDQELWHSDRLVLTLNAVRSDRS